MGIEEKLKIKKLLHPKVAEPIVKTIKGKKGDRGLPGKPGKDGKPGKNGVSIKGTPGKDGEDGRSIKGESGKPGQDGKDWNPTKEELKRLKGEPGEKGQRGKHGNPGSFPKEIDYIDFDTSATPEHKEGRLHWDDDSGTLELGLAGGTVHLQIGQEFLVRVTNKTGATLLNGKVIRNVGSQGNRPTVDLASAAAEYNQTGYAILTEEIENNQSGYATFLGIVREIDTSAWVEGTALYLSITPGEITDTAPEAPNHTAWMGVVLNSHATEGAIYFKPNLPMNIHNLSDVNGTAADTTNKVLIWDEVNKYWDPGSLDSDYPTRDEWGQNGFSTRTTSAISFDDNTRTFSMQPTGTDFEYWLDGIKYTSTGDTIQISDVEGIHIIRYSASGIEDIDTPTGADVDISIRKRALISILYWDKSEAKQIYLGEERHGVTMSPAIHNYLHHLEGLRYNYGLGLNTFNVDATGNNAIDAQFGTDMGSVIDEDIPVRPAAVLSTVGLPIYYMQGAAADFQKYINTGFSVRTFDGTSNTRLVWNEYTGGAWQLTEVGNSHYVLCHIFATTELNNPMIAVIGQTDYLNKTAARAGALTEILELSTNDILFPEVRPIATVIFHTADNKTNDVKAAVVSTDDGENYIDWRSESISRTSISTSDHGSLVGLLSDDHTQYSLADGTRAFTGVVSGITPTADAHLATKKYVDDLMAAHIAAYH